MDKKTLSNKIKELESLKTLLEAELAQLPRGQLRIDATKNNGQFYTKDNNKWKYISKKNTILIKGLAQRNYDEKLLKLTKHNLRTLKAYMEIISYNRIEDLYNNMCATRQGLVDKHNLAESEYADYWSKQTYSKKEVINGFITDKGELVRSKSELIIANKLYTNKIPYFYEKPLNMGSHGIWHPDFTVLNVRTRQEVIFEHFGFIDNPEYAKNMVAKINIYASRGYIQGRNLIFTMENETYPLDIKAVTNLINYYFK